jgi:hypothetical protein
MDMKLFVELLLDAAGAVLAAEAEFQLEAIFKQWALLRGVSSTFTRSSTAAIAAVLPLPYVGVFRLCPLLLLPAVVTARRCCFRGFFPLNSANPQAFSFLQLRLIALLTLLLPTPSISLGCLQSRISD